MQDLPVSRSERSYEGQSRTCPRYGYQKCPQDVWVWSDRKKLSYCGNKPIWLWPGFQGEKGHRKVKVKLVWEIDLESVPIMFGSEQIERNRVIMVISQFDLDLISRVKKVTQSSNPLWG